jgi:protein-disulfide isomerase
MATLRVPVSAADHFRGNIDAPVKLVEYGDYQCAHCGTAHPIVAMICKQMGDRLCFVFRHFPLTEVHPFAEPAAEASEFAGTYRRFWEMHDCLYENQRNLDLPVLLGLARILKLDALQMRDALATGRYRRKVRADFIGGARSGVNGTPTFFINSVRHDGTYAYDDLMSAIQQHSLVELKSP